MECRRHGGGPTPLPDISPAGAAKSSAPTGADAVAAYYRAYFRRAWPVWPAEQVHSAATMLITTLPARFWCSSFRRYGARLPVPRARSGGLGAHFAQRGARSRNRAGRRCRPPPSSCSEGAPAARREFVQSHVLTKRPFDLAFDRICRMWRVSAKRPGRQQAPLLKAAAADERVLGVEDAAEYGKWEGLL